MTTSEYCDTPESVVPQELAYGEFRVADSPSVNHQRVVGTVFRALVAFVEEHRLGEVIVAPMDVVLDFDAGVVVQPDVLFVSTARSNIVRDKVYGTPDLVIEVLSPSVRIGRLDQHLFWYARYGVRECWLLSIPQRTIEVVTFADQAIVGRRSFFYEEVVTSGVVEGLPLKPVDVLGFY